MRVGVDGRKIPRAKELGAVASFAHAQSMGMEGLFFRTVLDVSPTLDAGYLREVRSEADRLGMYVEAGLGKVNPFAVPETPELRAVGDGDIVRGFRRMMEACAAVDVLELWVSTANYKPEFYGRWAYDRFRTDVSWADQLAATTKFMKTLAPIARDLGIHLNLETHEEITSFEIVRIIDEVGDDVAGVVFDTGNVVQRAEHPVWAARRLADHVRQTHIKDAFLTYEDGGIVYQSRECGVGVIDFSSILPILQEANPALNLSIENNYSLQDQPLIYRNNIEIFDPEWRAAHPDLTVDELADYFKMVNDYQERIQREGIVGFTEYHERDFGYRAAVEWIKDSGAHLRSVLAGMAAGRDDLEAVGEMR